MSDVAENVTPDAQVPEPTPQPDEKAPATYQADDAIGSSADGGTTKTLFALLARHPFWDLYLTTTKVKKLSGRAWFCFVLDMVVRLAIVGLILGIIAAVAWKTLSPIHLP